MQISGTQAAALLGFVGIVVGSMLPWARVAFFTVSGTDGDGMISLVLGVVGFFLILISRSALPAIMAAIAGGAACAIGIYDLGNVADLASKPPSQDALFSLKVQVGTGLYLLIGAGALAAVASLMLSASFSSPALSFRCRECGFAIQPDDRLCPDCGAELTVRRRYRRI